MIIYRLILLILILCLVPLGGYADVYRYIDENGVERYSNKPPPEGTTIIDTDKEIEYDEAADRAQHERDQETIENFANQPAPTVPAPAPAASPQKPAGNDVDISEDFDDDDVHIHRRHHRKKHIRRK